MTTFNLRADQCPPVPTPGQYPSLGFSVAGAAPPCAESLPFGLGGMAYPALLSRLAARVDLGARLGAGAWAVGEGLALSPGAGLLVSVSAGRALIDGVVELAVGQPVAVPDNAAVVWVWLLRGGPGASPSLLASRTLALPASPCVLLGNVTTSGGAVTAVDGSGVLRLVGGRAQRRTADLGVPRDAPPADAAFDALTPAGHFFWDGAAYAGGAAFETLLTGAAHNVNLTPGANYLIGWDFSGAGLFGDALYRAGLSCTDPLLVVNEAVGQKARGKVFFNLHYSGAGASAVALSVQPSAKGAGWTGGLGANVLAGGAWDGLTTIS